MVSGKMYYIVGQLKFCKLEQEKWEGIKSTITILVKLITISLDVHIIL